MRDGSHVSQVVHQIVVDSQTESEDYSSSDESSFETLQDALTTRSRAFPGNFSSQKDPREDSRMEAMDFEVLDPALRPSLVIDGTKIEAPGKLWQQRSKLSQSPTIDFKREVSVPCTTSNGMSTVEGPRSRSVPPKVGPKAEIQSFSSRGVDRPTHRAVDINEDNHMVATEGNQTACGTESRQIILSTDAEMVTKGANMSQGGQTVQQIPHKAFDASYGFSDEEDEIEPVQPRRSFRFQAPVTVTNRHPGKTQLIDLTVEDSAPAHNITMDRQASKISPRRGNQSPISISSSLSASNLSESEEVKFFLEPSTPIPPIADSHMTLSEILGPDDFEELRKSSPILLRKLPQERTKFLGSGEGSQASLDEVRLSPARNPTPKRRTPISTTRASILRRSLEASPSGSMIETPGGSKKRCGENGFRCGKGFCFKCLEG